MIEPSGEWAGCRYGQTNGIRVYTDWKGHLRTFLYSYGLLTLDVYGVPRLNITGGLVWRSQPQFL